MEPTPQLIQDLRDLILKKVEEDASDIPGGIHPADLGRITNGDDWLRRFLLHNDNDVKESLNMAWETCKWRKTFGTNDINEQNIKLDYVEDGSMFVRNKDKDGKSLFILRCKKHIKGQRDLEELKKCVVYWFERLERQDKGDMITIFFDMSDTGLSNMDMEYTKYLISLFKLYYPYFLNYILIFEMPWVLNAAFKIIKSWLPEKAVKKINFVTKSNLKNFVDPDQALSIWGGQDNYEFSFVAEDRNGKMERKVHFADTQSDSSPGADVGPGLKIKVSPSDCIIFAEGQGSDMSGSLSLANTDDKIISYKVKTTSPEKFRVRPCLGVLKPGGSIAVAVSLHSNVQPASVSRDKFLIMGMQVDSPNLTQQDLTDLWKQKSHAATEITRLRCSTGMSVSDGSIRNGGILESPPGSPADKFAKLTRNVTKLVDSNAAIESELRSTRLFLNVLLVIVSACGLGITYLIWLLQSVLAEEKSGPVSHLDEL